MQDLQILKLNIMYTMGYLNSYFNMAKLIESEFVQKERKYDIESLLDLYFNSPTSEFYNKLTEG